MTYTIINRAVFTHSSVFLINDTCRFNGDPQEVHLAESPFIVCWISGLDTTPGQPLSRFPLSLCWKFVQISCEWELVLLQVGSSAGGGSTAAVWSWLLARPGPQHGPAPSPATTRRQGAHLAVHPQWGQPIPPVHALHHRVAISFTTTLALPLISNKFKYSNCRNFEHQHWHRSQESARELVRFPGFYQLSCCTVDFRHVSS